MRLIPNPNALSALIVPVPEAEPHVGYWRSQYDWSASHGMLPHITLACPFIDTGLLSPKTIAVLRATFAAKQPVHFCLRGPHRFKDYVYLAPEPVGPFEALTLQLREQFSLGDTGDIFGALMPHLTIAHSKDQSILDKICNGLSGIEVTASLDRVQLMECHNEWWHLIEQFEIGSAVRI